MFKFLGIYCYAIGIFIIKLIFKYAFEYMVKIVTLQSKISHVLYTNQYSNNDMIEMLERK